MALLLTSMWFGVMVMAYSLLLSTVIGSIINSFPNRKLLGYGYFEQIKDILPSILLAAVMGAAVFCVQFLALPDIWILFIQVPLGAMIYIAGAILFKFESFYYVWNMLKKLFKKDKPKGEKE